MTQLIPCGQGRGPVPAKILIVGEAPGEQEELSGFPFVGASGQELTRMLAEGGIDRKECFLTNTLWVRPPNNNLEELCTDKAEAGKDYAFPPIVHGKYLRAEFLPELDRLKEEVQRVQPNLVLALGNTACWGLLGTRSISSIRGVVAESSLCPGVKVLPTYHPSAVLRNWSLRAVVIADFLKAARERETPHIIRPSRTVTINPTLAEISEWLIKNASAKRIAVDTETGFRTIKCIGFAADRKAALVVPFFDEERPGGNYWATLEDEQFAWRLVRQILALPGIKVHQNGLYDLQYVMRMGINPRNCYADTMLRHHALYPELQKSLGFLGSIYTNEQSWKLMNRQGEGKRDE